MSSGSLYVILIQPQAENSYVLGLAGSYANAYDKAKKEIVENKRLYNCRVSLYRFDSFGHHLTALSILGAYEFFSLKGEDTE